MLYMNIVFRFLYEHFNVVGLRSFYYSYFLYSNDERVKVGGMHASDEFLGW